MLKSIWKFLLTSILFIVVLLSFRLREVNYRKSDIIEKSRVKFIDELYVNNALLY